MQEAVRTRSTPSGVTNTDSIRGPKYISTSIELVPSATVSGKKDVLFEIRVEQTWGDVPHAGHFRIRIPPQNGGAQEKWGSCLSVVNRQRRAAFVA